MKPRTYTLNAFILKRKNYHEADKIITVFSQEKGRVTLIAKGIRKISSRRAGTLELFNNAILQIAKSRGDIDIITEVSLNTSYSSFSQDFEKTNIAYQLTELVDKFTFENQENLELFELLQKAFDFIKKTQIDKNKVNAISTRFKIRILELLGFGLPQNLDPASLTEYIENLLEKRLVADGHFEI
jgi:DNA repair protein RecO (recombination protein O)